MLNIIVATGNNGEIGENNKLLYPIKEDLVRFKKLTTNNIVVMGRKTFESLPEKNKPLPNRTNIVLTRNKNFKEDNVIIYNSLEDFLKDYGNSDEEIFIIGGGEIYNQFLSHIDRMYLTLIEKEFPHADTYFKYDKNWRVIESENNKTNEDVSYKFVTLERNEEK